MWICINTQKIRLLHWFVLEIWLIKKSCNLIGWEHFGPYFPEFCQIWDLCRNIANNIHFHYRTNSVKINDKIFQYIHKTLFLAHFWPIFPILGAKIFFLENQSVTHNSYGLLASCQNLEKTNDKIPRKCRDRQKARQKAGQTLFHRTLPANTRGPKSQAYQQNLKEAKETDSVNVLQLNFSENFSDFYQDEVQTKNKMQNWPKSKLQLFFMILAQRFMGICSCNIWWFTPLQGLNNCFHK